MQRSSIAVTNLHRDIAHPLRIAESLSRHSRYAGIVQAKVKMWVSHALKRQPWNLTLYESFIACLNYLLYIVNAYLWGLIL